jgi:hypothetical protein
VPFCIVRLLTQRIDQRKTGKPPPHAACKLRSAPQARFWGKVRNDRIAKIRLQAKTSGQMRRKHDYDNLRSAPRKRVALMNAHAIAVTEIKNR